MNLKKSINKKGSYLVEATIAMPIFLVAVIVMSSIILMFHCIEDSNFIMATSMRRAAIESHFTDVASVFPARITNNISEHSQVESQTITDYKYRVDMWGNDEIIALKIRMNMHTSNPLNLASSASYDVALCTRAYVGKEREADPMSAEEFASDGDAVFIFPARGEKYHNKNCGVLVAASTATVLTKELKNRYKSCPKCKSSKAALGELIYVFLNEGEAYHLPGCKTLTRNYIEVDRKTAKKRGYTACSKCGG